MQNVIVIVVLLIAVAGVLEWWLSVKR